LKDTAVLSLKKNPLKECSKFLWKGKWLHQRATIIPAGYMQRLSDIDKHKILSVKITRRE